MRCCKQLLPDARADVFGIDWFVSLLEAGRKVSLAVPAVIAMIAAGIILCADFMHHFLFAIFTCNLHNVIVQVHTVCVRKSH